MLLREENGRVSATSLVATARYAVAHILPSAAPGYVSGRPLTPAEMARVGQPAAPGILNRIRWGLAALPGLDATIDHGRVRLFRL
jgi:hypothetical protein